MLTAPENTVKLTDEHNAELEVFKGRILVAEEELQMRERRLKVIKSDTERAVKEKEYQEAQLQEVSNKFKDREQELQDIAVAIASAREEQKKAATERVEADKKAAERDSALIVREEQLSSQEKELAKRERAVVEKEQELSFKEESIHTAETRLQEALNGLWK